MIFSPAQTVLAACARLSFCDYESDGDDSDEEAAVDDGVGVGAQVEVVVDDRADNDE